jgi:hypothetical protein
MPYDGHKNDFHTEYSKKYRKQRFPSEDLEQAGVNTRRSLTKHAWDYASLKFSKQQKAASYVISCCMRLNPTQNDIAEEYTWKNSLNHTPNINIPLCQRHIHSIGDSTCKAVTHMFVFIYTSKGDWWSIYFTRTSFYPFHSRCNVCPWWSQLYSYQIWRIVALHYILTCSLLINDM